MGCYGLYFIYSILSYYYGLKYVVNKDIVDTMFMEKMIVVGIIVGIAVLLKIWDKVRLANILLGVPVGITVFIFIVSVLAILFLAIVFILFGNK